MGNLIFRDEIDLNNLTEELLNEQDENGTF